MAQILDGCYEQIDVEEKRRKVKVVSKREKI